MTPLFPKDNEPIIIKQGQTGNCYLLSALDCVFNQDMGRKHIQSLFTQNADGSVTLRLKRTTQSAHLKVAKLTGKYDYSLDKATNEDVFIISKKRLEEIDQDWIGADTNSLAVKILEHISPYYFFGSWDPLEKGQSILAHNIVQRYQESSTVFVSNFLGIHYYDCDNLDQISVLKELYPELPVFISMAWGGADATGWIPGQHALRIKDCHKASEQKNYKFTLVNPWNNQKTEEHLATEISRYDFCVFSMDKALPLILKTKIYQKIPYIFSLYKRVTSEGKELICQLLTDSKGDKIRFLTSFFKRFPSQELMTIFLAEEKQFDDVKAIMKGLVLQPMVNKHLADFFNKPEFFQWIVKTAISHKSAELKSVDAAEQFIKNGLKVYYFDKNRSKFLTNKVALRQFFESSVFSNTQIAAYLPADELLSFAVTRLIGRHHNKSMIDYIQVANAPTDADSFVDNLLSTITNRNTQDLYVALKVIEDLNPKLSQLLFPLICNKLDKHAFNPSFIGLIEQITLENESPFKTWLLKKHSAALAEKKTAAEQIFDNLAVQLKNYPFSFESLYTFEEVDARLQQLNSSLSDLFAQSDVQNAHQILGIPKGQWPATLMQAFQQKALMLYEVAIEKKMGLHGAKAVLADYLLRIKAISLDFDRSDSATAEQVVAKRDELKTTLASMLNEADLIDAHKKLGITLLEPKTEISVWSAILEKTQEVDQKAAVVIDKALKNRAQLIQHNQNMLNSIKFDTLLNEIGKMRDALRANTLDYDVAKMESYPMDSYEKAFGTARILYEALTGFREQLLLSRRSTSTTEFKASCLGAITKALPVLETHRGWKQFFANILNGLLSLVGCADPRLFKTQTTSAKVTKELEAALNGLQNASVPLSLM